MGGTGGQFLCHFIVSAKRNIKDRIVNLSEYGNAHFYNLSDIQSHGKLGIRSSDLDKINYILSTKPNIGAAAPYYIGSHILDIELINNTFEKSIRITYEPDDIDQINVIIFGKNHKRPNKVLSNAMNLRLLKEHIEQFSKKEKMTNILFVSWKELFSENIDDLIQKISTFTEIDSDNFSKESIIYWREKTQYCIDTFNV